MLNDSGCFFRFCLTSYLVEIYFELNAEYSDLTHAKLCRHFLYDGLAIFEFINDRAATDLYIIVCNPIVNYAVLQGENVSRWYSPGTEQATRTRYSRIRCDG